MVEIKIQKFCQCVCGISINQSKLQISFTPDNPFPNPLNIEIVNAKTRRLASPHRDVTFATFKLASLEMLYLELRNKNSPFYDNQTYGNSRYFMLSFSHTFLHTPTKYTCWSPYPRSQIYSLMRF